MYRKITRGMDHSRRTTTSINWHEKIFFSSHFHVPSPDLINIVRIVRHEATSTSSFFIRAGMIKSALFLRTQAKMRLGTVITRGLFKLDTLIPVRYPLQIILFMDIFISFLEQYFKYFSSNMQSGVLWRYN